MKTRKDFEQRLKEQYILNNNFSITNKSFLLHFKETIKGGPKIFIKKFNKLLSIILINLYSIVLISLIFILIKAIKPFIIIRFGLLETNAFGHYSHCIEIYLCEKKRGFHQLPKKTIDIWCTQQNICNSFLHKKWKKNFIILPRGIVYPIFLTFKKKPFFHEHLVPMRYEGFNGKKNMHNDIHNVLSVTEPLIKFSHEEIQLCKKLLNKMGIEPEEDFVTLHCRDSSYWGDIDNPQSAKIETFYKAVDHINNHYKLKVIRMGKGSEKKIINKNKMFLDYANSEFRSDLLDIYILSKTFLHIGTQGGFNVAPNIFRKHYIQTNVFLNIGAEYGNENYMFIPKKIYQKNKDKLIGINDLKKFFRHNERYSLLSSSNHKNFEIIDNTEQEILELVDEKLKKLFGNWKESEESLIMQKKFQEKNLSFFEDIKIRGKIGQNFLEKNQYLLN